MWKSGKSETQPREKLEARMTPEDSRPNHLRLIYPQNNRSMLIKILLTIPTSSSSQHIAHACMECETET